MKKETLKYSIKKAHPIDARFEETLGSMAMAPSERAQQVIFDKLATHNVDLRFKSAFNDLAVLPSKAANEAFLKQIQPPLPYFQYFRAAAAMAVLVSISFFLFNNQPKAYVAAVKVPEKTFSSNKVESEARLVKSIVPQRTKTEPKLQVETESIAVAIPEMIALTETPKVEIIQTEENEIIRNGKVEPLSKPKVVETKPEIFLTYTEISDELDQKFRKRERLRNFDEEPITLAAQLINYTEKEEEPVGILAKISNQYRHLKNGEKLSLRELGLRKRDLKAKIDGMFEEDKGLIDIKRTHTVGN